METPKIKLEKKRDSADQSFWRTKNSEILVLLGDKTKTNQEKSEAVANLRAEYFLERTRIPLFDDIDDREIFYTHATPTKNVMDIIDNGIMAPNFAKRIKKENYGTQYKYNPDSPRHKTVFLGYGFMVPWKDGQPVFIIDPNSEIVSPEESFGGETGAKHRVAPRDIIALLLPENLLDFDMTAIREYFEKNPAKSLPIFLFREGKVTESVHLYKYEIMEQLFPPQK
jgi:hypothetical protein